MAHLAQRRLAAQSFRRICVNVCVCVAAGFAWSWGPLGWLVPSEIQTLETRAAGMSVAVTVNFLFSVAPEALLVVAARLQRCPWG